jgi:hypothetical protein
MAARSLHVVTSGRPLQHRQRYDRVVVHRVGECIMSKRHVWVACSLAWLCASAHATVSDAVHSAASAASGVATKVERSVKRGVNAAASGVEHGAKAAGRAANTGAKKVGVPGAGASQGKPSQPAGERSN